MNRYIAPKRVDMIKKAEQLIKLKSKRSSLKSYLCATHICTSPCNSVKQHTIFEEIVGINRF